MRTKYVTALLSVWVFQREDTKKLVGPIPLKCKRERELEWARRAFRLQHKRTEGRRKDGNRTADSSAVLSMSWAACGQPWHKDGPRRVLHGIEVARLWCPSMSVSVWELSRKGGAGLEHYSRSPRLSAKCTATRLDFLLYQIFIKMSCIVSFVNFPKPSPKCPQPFSVSCLIWVMYQFLP